VRRWLAVDPRRYVTVSLSGKLTLNSSPVVEAIGQLGSQYGVGTLMVKVIKTVP
jgi:hypothetical protein